MNQISGASISFAQWALWGVPFGVAASYASCWVITRLFLDKDRLDRELHVARSEHAPVSPAERNTVVVLALMVALWLSEGLHGLREPPSRY